MSPALPQLDLEAVPHVPMWRLAACRKPGLQEGDPLGPVWARVRAVQPGDSPRYRTLCALPPDGPVPLLWPFLVAAPLQKAVLARPEFPLPLLGLVHVTQRVWAARPVHPAESLTLEVTARTWRPARRGVHVDLDTLYRDASGGCVWWGRTTAWSPHGPGHGRPNPSRRHPVLDEQGGVEVDVPEWMGRSYGTVAGDRNPIHVHAWLARPFGFKRAIVHGMWTLARSLAVLGDRVPHHAVELRAEFLRPVELPSRGRVEVGADGDGVAFAWHGADRPCLWGTVRGVVEQAPADGGAGLGRP